MSLSLFEWEDLIFDFCEDEDFEEIYQQLWAEYHYEGINFGHIEYILYRPEGTHGS